MKKFSSPSIFKNSIISLKDDFEYSQKQLIQSLINNGYKQVDLVLSKGEFSVRGDTVHVFNISCDYPVKIEFFDNTIESITMYNLDDFKSIKKIKNFDILPTSDFIFRIENKSQLYSIIEADFHKSVKNLDANEQIKLKTNFEEFKINFEAENYLYIKNWLVSYVECCGISQYVNSNALVVFDDTKLIVDSLKNEYEQFKNSYDLLLKSGEILLGQKNRFIAYDDVFKLNFQMVSFQQITTANKIFQPTHIESYKSSAETNYYGNYDLLLEDVRYYCEFNNRIVIFAGSQSIAQYLCKFLSQNNVNVKLKNDVENLSSLSAGEVIVSSEDITYGGIFIEDKLVIIGTKELLKKTSTKKVVANNKKDEFTLPKAGDYVVHENFGIALCQGVQRLKFSNYEKDYIILQYDGGDKLYLPTEQIGLISTYVSSGKEPKLNKLGSKEFENTKAKVKSKLKELAFDLIGLYREREQIRGVKYEVDKKSLIEFENTFPYDETDDQISAISDVICDMKSGKVMDRILCGDVGYGKTEVALRSAFIAASNNKQTCFLAPTTILSEQHYNTAKSRLEAFGINVECLNRFKTKKEQIQILQKLKNGEIDVICGTHRLLSSDVVFKDLGLLILDEEQRFGVGDKEKIKRLKSNINVLTLSATPIPRTLHMGLVGIRDISLITTPPKGRLPVQTTVAEYSDVMVLSAINRELARNGQVLIIYNRVETIYDFASHIRSLVGKDIKIGVAHGQMDAGELENEILNLYKGNTNILISTTLIENGIDLPSANTLIVIDADKLGLSQLYQLKGRVGRSKNLGYAYFTFKKNVTLSQDAYKRLNAIMEFTELGSGFKIAMKDLEIRGCGNVLGAEQSGHMAKVGYDMYCKILSQAVNEIKGQKQKEYKDIKLDVATNCYIPENYIESSENRFRIYNNLKQINSSQQLNKVLNEIETLFGKVPEEIENLAYVALLRNLAREFEVKKINIDKERCQAEFYDKTTMLNKNIYNSLKQLQIKVYYSDTGSIMNFMLREYSIRKKLRLLCEVFEKALMIAEKEK
ncbi:MAG TPA: transcription-repair coupling factor [Clostridiales bacterium]|nr:transcription-repair coupling factor [Clostridiales bacterium]